MGQFAIALGVLVQYLRAKKSFPEWAALLIIGVIGVGGYWLNTDGANIASKTFWSEAFKWVLETAGVTQLTSSAANVGVPMAPKTNSQ